MNAMTMVDGLLAQDMRRMLGMAVFVVSFVLVLRSRPWRWLLPILRGRSRG